MRSTRILKFLFCFFSASTFAQTISLMQNEEGGEYPMGRNGANNPCITPEQYKIIEKQNIDNCKLFGISYGNQKSAMATTFSWPLKMANSLNDCSYYYIGNYVDQDTTSPGIKDWNCGSVTYDGHRGNDICTSPYPFYKMDNNQVEVIAAAPGTIVNKVDGNFDKNCAANNSTANYIIIQHADGSVALYWHMKKNSLTAKTVGQTVVTGEYLGVVGSSGSSSGPHLHFEVWSGITANTLKDAYSGTCNSLNANSLWVIQKPYTEPAIIKVQVNSIAPIFPACPATETSNEDTCFAAGATGKFYIFIRNETSGLKANMRIVNPDGSNFSSWIHNSVNTYNLAYWVSNKVLPPTAGTYTFEAIYNGITCSKKFMINCSPLEVSTLSDPKAIQVYPNPTNNMITLSSTTDLGLITICNTLGEIVYSQVATDAKQQIDISKQASGIYFLRVQHSYIKIIKE